MVTLKPITQENYQQVIALSDQLSTTDRSKIADNVYSLADAYVYDYAWPRAVYVDDTLVGFLMLGFDNFLADKNDTPTVFIWRLMIIPSYQNKGIGKALLAEIVFIAKQRECRFIHVFVHKNTPMPKQFYLNNGFEDTHTVYGDEVLLKRQIDA